MPPRRRRPAPEGPEAGLVFDPDPRHLLHPVGSPRGTPASQRFRVQRARDLVNLQCSAYSCLVEAADPPADAGPPVLRADGAKARLEVRLPFQHIGEQSFAAGDDPPGQAVKALAANGSRLVFEVPEAERIELSVAGVLAALSRLPLVVVPVAQPRPTLKLRELTSLDPLAFLPGGVGLVRGPDGLAFVPLTRRQQTRAATEVLGDPIRAARELSLVRQLTAHETPVDLTAGRVGGFDILLPPRFSLVRRGPRAPRSDETAIEAPYRLALSPSAAGGFTHATRPVPTPGTLPAADGRDNIELWHSRLGVRRTTTDPETGAVEVRVDETSPTQRVVRAVWARDLENGIPAGHTNDPFRMPLDGRDRSVLVRQTSDPASPTPLLPVDADKLYVSALGATLDLHGYWPASGGISPEILSWDHVAPMGRDQFVKVVYPGYLFPFGHQAALVKQTTRQVDSPSSNPVARLHTEFFLVITQPVRSFDARDLPFGEVRVRPLVTPGLLDPNSTDALVAVKKQDPPHEIYGQKLFWPTRASDGQRFEFVLECLDRDGRRARLATPLLFVGQTIDEGAVSLPVPGDVEAAWNARPIDGRQQRIAFAPGTTPGQTAQQTAWLRFTGTPAAAPVLSSTPHLRDADVVIPAVRHLAPPGTTGTSTVSYAQVYLDDGFGGANTVLEQFLALAGPAGVDFTKGTDHGGGFVAPSLGVEALTRVRGAVGRTAGYGPGGFDPKVALAGLLPKLFGVFELTDLLGVDLPVPELVGEALDEIAALLADLAALQAAANDAVARLGIDATEAATQGLRTAAADAGAAIDAAAGGLAAAVDALAQAVADLQDVTTPSDLAAVTARLGAIPDDLRTEVQKVKAAVTGRPLPTAVRAALDRPLDAVLAVLGDAAAFLDSIHAFVNGLAQAAGLAEKVTYTWSTPLSSWPAPGSGALFRAEKGGRESRFALHVEARPSGPQAGVDVGAEITDFALNLFPDASLIALEFDRLAFHARTGAKADVDVVFDGIVFQGVLGFVNTLKELIPIDGFSDPPYLEVDSGGLRAGFDLALPSVGVGVFSLENISLHAGVDVPFLGEALTVGFSFCTRDKPFRLTVMCIGGGGFVGVTLSPKGLVVLEMSLEAGACLSIDLGVASGSVSIMVGVYLRLEGEGGSLTGYFRIRGEVNVLGLISASITLELSLKYDFGSGKLIGQASIDIEVEVFLVSFSVSVSCERRLAGSNGDPTYAEVLTLLPAGDSPEWDAYCAAFAAE